MTRFHCLSCGDLTPANDPFPWMPGGQAHAHRAGCPGGRVIPIATLCNEPTVIDESDLAPGMVVVAVDDGGPEPAPWITTPDAYLLKDYGLAMAERIQWLGHADDVVVRYVAGEG